MAARRGSAAAEPDTITDPVDWAAHFWQEQGLNGDESGFLALTSLLRLERLVVDAAERELRQVDLHLTDYLMLMTLQLSSSGTRLISSLARNLMVHATTATLAVDRLEARGLLARSPHPTDRRATCVSITPTGRELSSRATTALDQISFGLHGNSPHSIERLRIALTEARRSAGDT